MSITTTTLTRAAGICAVAGGLLFLAVQINHPHPDAEFARTAEFAIRQAVKVGFATLSLVGVTGMYLRQVKQTGVLGLLGYLLLALAFLTLTCVEVMGAVVLPVLAHSDAGYVQDVLAVANNGTATGDLGLFPIVNTVAGMALLGGGLLFGIAMFRARVLARWAAALLAISVVATLAIRVLPQVSERLFAVPIGVALVALGASLWREQRTRPVGAALQVTDTQLESVTGP
jgi:hypothetical protein